MFDLSWARLVGWGGGVGVLACEGGQSFFLPLPRELDDCCGMMLFMVGVFHVEYGDGAC